MKELIRQLFDIAASRACRALSTGDGSGGEVTPIDCRQQFKPFVKVKRGAMVPGIDAIGPGQYLRWGA
ncbi:hypothetical protein [Bradyrhizobium tropiciagri]|uniref:hypothetical protein n=1 Tax=Bradyrhizobium tropiciagri TaxID=312253 RepID=UPI0010099874|nr:hypothetical protein [Bradyrhizobium tropiciagri]